ncbi:hypothetical protein MPOR_40080 [Mycolicibacterium poriferae]|uniref:Uncharacterized protein n=1 Tax=Mycolicibacterium poriferae TaxID=39694 RepID=A0A6N4VB70_9MYCO|nr:hypothetical protein MPOR_40080 [Mycolicibacterium poriferae]
MLADQGLGQAQRVDQFVHASGGFAQLQHDGDAHRRSQGSQQLAGGVEDGAGRQFGRRRATVVVSGGRVSLSGNDFH